MQNRLRPSCRTPHEGVQFIADTSIMQVIVCLAKELFERNVQSVHVKQ